MRHLKRDLLQSHVVTGQRVMALKQKRADLDLVLGRNYSL